MPPGLLGHTTGAGGSVGKEMEETSVGRAQLLLKEQPNKKAAEFAAKRPVLIQVYAASYFIMMKQKIDIFDVVHQNDALDAQR